MRALIVNNFTPRNIGDAAIVEGLVVSLRRTGYHHITAAVMYPEEIDAWLAIGVDEVVPSLFRARGTRPRRVFDLLRCLVSASAGVLRLRRTSAVAAYRNADLVVSVGGGYLGAGRVLTNLLAGLNVSYARLWAKPTLAAPMSFRPATRLVGLILRKTLCRTVLFARDSLSARLFRDAGLRAFVAPDLALRSPSLVSIERETAYGAIGWAPRDYAHDHDLRWSDAIAIREMRSLAQKGYRIKLITQCTAPSADDRRAVARIAMQLPEAEVLAPASTVAQACEQYASVDALLAGRMHAALAAICAGTPALAVRYEEKVSGLFGDLGIGDWAVAEAEGIADRLESIVGERRTFLVDWSRWDRALTSIGNMRSPRVDGTPASH